MSGKNIFGKWFSKKGIFLKYGFIASFLSVAITDILIIYLPHFNSFLLESSTNSDTSLITEKERSNKLLRINKKQNVQIKHLQSKLKKAEDDLRELSRRMEVYKTTCTGLQEELQCITPSYRRLLNQLDDIMANESLNHDDIVQKIQELKTSLYVGKTQEMLAHVAEGQGYIDQELPADVRDLVDNITWRTGDWLSLGKRLAVNGETLKVIEASSQTHGTKVLGVIKAWFKENRDGASVEALNDVIDKLASDEIKENPMCDDEMRALHESSGYLIDNILAVDGICDEMRQSGMMDQLTMENITLEKDDRKRKLALISVLPRLGQGCLKSFCDALEKTDNLVCAKRLKGELTDQPEEIPFDTPEEPTRGRDGKKGNFDLPSASNSSKESDGADEGNHLELPEYDEGSRSEPEGLNDSFQKLVFLVCKALKTLILPNSTDLMQQLQEQIEVHRELIEHTTKKSSSLKDETNRTIFGTKILYQGSLEKI